MYIFSIRPLSNLSFLCCLIILLLANSCHGRFHCYHCNPHYHIEPTVPPLQKMGKPIRLALVLGSGGARGMAHVGVLEEFERANIPIDLIVGCSAGGLVGAFYANYPNAAYLKSILHPLTCDDLLDTHWISARYGLGRGDAIRNFLTSYLGYKCFEDLHLPLIVVTTDLLSGSLVAINSGPIVPTIHASCALPLYYRPVHLYGRIFVDGGVADPIPVKVAKSQNPQLIVAVHVSDFLSSEQPNHLFEIARRSTEIMWLKHADACLKEADIVIRPNVDGVGTFDDQCNEALYEAGRAAALSAIPGILKALQGLACNETSES
jgi:NTE family protein